MLSNSIRFFHLIVILTTYFVFFSSCIENDLISPITEIPEDSTYNYAYEDSILFDAYSSANFMTIHISSISGNGIRPITSSLVCYDPSWSSNKRRILFMGTPIDGNGIWNIYLLSLTNYKIYKVPLPDDKLQCAAYSPDMKYIAYSIWNDSSQYKIKLYKFSDGSTRELTGWLNNQIIKLSWSQNSKEILFYDGLTINIESLNITTLFTHNNRILFSSWSPDGKKIAFSSNGPMGYLNIFIYNVDSGTTKVLYPKDGRQCMASWSSDSNQLLFDQYTERSPNYRYICKINLDGSNFVKLTDGTRDISSPCWYK